MICDTFFMILKLKNHMTQRTFLISFQQMTFKLYASYSYNNQTNKACIKEKNEKNIQILKVQTLLYFTVCLVR